MHHKAELWLEGLRQGRNMRFKPLGASMIPFLREGDVITVTPGAKCQVGDIVLCSLGEDLIMHRVVAIFTDHIITKGDALRHLDPPVAQKDILGRATSWSRNGKVHSLESIGSRLLGLSFCLTLAWIPKSMVMLAVLKGLGLRMLGLSLSQGTTR